MVYKNFKDEVKLSRLGMGNMRLPVRMGEEGEEINYEAAKAIINNAIKAGVNYFDTAYIYHGGESEVFLGKALKDIRGTAIMLRINLTIRQTRITENSLHSSWNVYRWTELIFIFFTAFRIILLVKFWIADVFLILIR